MSLENANQDITEQEHPTTEPDQPVNTTEQESSNDGPTLAESMEKALVENGTIEESGTTEVNTGETETQEQQDQEPRDNVQNIAQLKETKSPDTDDIGKPQVKDNAEQDDITKTPEGLSDDGQERFKRLTDGYKSVSEKYETTTKQFNDLRGMISEVATPEEFGQALEYFRAIKSGDKTQVQNALKTLDGQRELLAKAIGEQVPGVDLLAEFPDLKQRVENFELTPEDALQIANSKRATQALAENQQRIEQQNNASQQWEGRVNNASNLINQYEQELTAKDPDYAQLKEVMMPQLQQMAKTLAPEEWGNAFLNAYASIKKAVAQSRKPPAPGNQPITSTGINTGVSAPKTVQDALMSHFGI